jgi:transcriptional regulator with XRE-family HTH domain
MRLGVRRLDVYTHLVQYRRGMSLAKNDPARGERLKALREARKLTQIKAALKIGVDPGTVSRWERGGIILPKNLDKLCEVYETNADFVVYGTDAESVETYPAFAEYMAWLEKHPEELAALPEGALENIRTFRLRLAQDYEPNLQNYMVLHGFMTGLKRKKRSRT